MREHGQKLRSIYSVNESQFDAATLPSRGTGYVDWIISYFSNRAEQGNFGVFNDGRRKDMAKLLRADADGPLYCPHAADLNAIADALDGSRPSRVVEVSWDGQKVLRPY